MGRLGGTSDEDTLIPAEVVDSAMARDVPVIVTMRPLRQGEHAQHTTGRRREMPLRDLLARMRHDGCGGIAGNAELLTGIEGVSSRPARKIVL